MLDSKSAMYEKLCVLETSLRKTLGAEKKAIMERVDEGRRVDGKDREAEGIFTKKILSPHLRNAFSGVLIEDTASGLQFKDTFFHSCAAPDFLFASGKLLGEIKYENLHLCLLCLDEWVELLSLFCKINATTASANASPLFSCRRCPLPQMVVWGWPCAPVRALERPCRCLERCDCTRQFHVSSRKAQT